MEFAWRCPFCNHDTTITDPNYSTERHDLEIENAEGFKIFNSTYIVCPNRECNKYTLNVSLHNSVATTSNKFKRDTRGNLEYGNLIKSYRLVPPSEAKVFPDYIPKAILEDYTEACLIRDLSPKASATLSRRCLQGMIRDFWKVSGKSNLKAEIEAIKDKVDPLTWKAIDAVRGIGNIGAHMEQDINLIIDVDSDEANRLIGLIEILIKDWYIAKHERKAHLEQITKLAKEKEDKRPKKEPEDTK